MYFYILECAKFQLILMKLSQLVKILDNIFPQKNALKDDKTGLQINCNDSEIQTIHIAYELNDEIINESIANNVELLIVFHPLIYRNLSSIDYNERVGDLLIKLIRNNISLYSVHTIFDTHPQGTNYLIAKSLGVKKISNIIDLNEDNNIGFGLIGEFDKAIGIDNLLKKCYEIFGNPLRYCKGKTKMIKKIAIIGGSGSSFIDNIIENDIDCFITADNSYHTFHRLNNKISLIDPGHYETEQFVAQGIFDILKNEKLLKKIKITKSIINTNPINYYYE